MHLDERPSPGMPTLGGKRAAAPSALIHGGQEGQELSFILNSFHLSYLLEAFSGIVDRLVQENFSGGKPPDPQIIVV